MSKRELFNAVELAAAVGCSAQHIRDLGNAGELPKVGTRLTRAGILLKFGQPVLDKLDGMPEKEDAEPVEPTEADLRLDEARKNKEADDLEAVHFGFIDAKDMVENASLKDKQNQENQDILAQGIEKLEADRKKFEQEQQIRVKQANDKIEEAKKVIELSKVKIKDADEKLAKAQEIESKANAIINAQTANEKQNQVETDIYETDKQDIPGWLQLAGKILSNVGKSTGNTYFTRCGVDTWNAGCDVYDLIAANKDRSEVKTVVEKAIAEVNARCELMQGKYHKYSDELERLNKCTEWLEQTCSIEWKPNASQDLLK